ncbi:conserved hypothetical protein [Mycobacterium tuberculosis]|uniref:Uncharacterized protein n=1 Tax=Mycobacterium tuberculosis (strain CDC 1551 / Oshkosh) TaxID=83331 RepID=Q8VIU7_MYCTO|nr:hypothetical protein MT3847 [Mycobacterium tuberculosis CDC1551]SIP66869.1 conserved hypothetical protein [Mycobacterium tuberculosis]
MLRVALGLTKASPVYLPGVKGRILLAGQLEHRSSWK